MLTVSHKFFPVADGTGSDVTSALASEDIALLVTETDDQYKRALADRGDVDGSGVVDVSDIEDIYRIFNVEMPEGYEGRSLSVSDVVEIVKSDSIKPGFYYCDSIGFKPVPFNSEYAKEPGNEKITVVMLEPGKVARTAEIGTSLKDLQKTVGGMIEAYYPFEEEVCIVCNA